WMPRWLKNGPTPLPLETNSPPKESAEALACLAKLPADAINYRIQNQFTAAVSLQKPTSRTAWERRRTELISRLKDKTFRWFLTEKIPFATKASKSGGSWAVRYGYADYEDVSFQSEPDVRIRAQLYAP